MTTKYQQGAAFERRIINALRLYNFHVIRSAGSKGIVDIAFYPIINNLGKGPPNIFNDAIDWPNYCPSVAQLKVTGSKSKLEVLTDCSELIHLNFKTPVNKYVIMNIKGELSIFRYDPLTKFCWKEQEILVKL